MAAVETYFAEESVQAELQRIRTEHFRREQYEEAAAACERLAADYAESKWLGEVLLLQAACYRELARPEDEMRALERFVAECPNHPQSSAARRALETLQAGHSMQAAAADRSAHIESLEKRVQALADTMESMGGKQAALDHQLSVAVARLTERVQDLDSRERALTLAADSDGAVPTAIELMNAVVQDMRAENEAQWQKMASQLHEMEKRLGEVARHKSVLTPLKAMVASALLASLLSVMIGIAVYDDVRGGVMRAALVQGVPRQGAGLASRVVKAARAQKLSAPKVVIARIVAPKPRLHAAGEPGTAGRSTIKSSAAPNTHPAAAKHPPARRPAVQEASQPSKRTGGVYVVKPGDTLWSVSKNALGNGKAVERIAAINGLAPPYNVRPGQRLRLPH